MALCPFNIKANKLLFSVANLRRSIMPLCCSVLCSMLSSLASCSDGACSQLLNTHSVCSSIPGCKHGQACG